MAGAPAVWLSGIESNGAFEVRRVTEAIPFRIGHPVAAALAAALALIVCLAGTGSGANAQQQKGPPPSRAAITYSFAPIVKKVIPAVVNVYVRSRQQSVVSPLFDDPLFRQFFGERFGMPRERVQNSLGSGVIVRSDGVVVTNTHVVKGSGATEIKVALADRREFDAKVILQDEKTDIAVLKIEGDGPFPVIEFADSDGLEVGDLVLAIGNPFGVGQTVTSGIVSALARSEVAESDAQIFIQTDAAINPGNSGGALVDMAGALVGINTAIYSRSGGYMGIGFAIPSNLVRLYVDSALSGRKVERPWIGAKLEPVTREVAEALGLNRVAGALVARVYPNGPAAEAGLQPGDIITAVDGIDVTDARTVNYRMTVRGVGSRSRLEVLRRGQKLALTVALRPPPQLSREDVRNLSGAHPFDGARVANLLPAIADELNLEPGHGVVIVSVRSGSTASKIGFQPGDLILQVGPDKIATVDELERALRNRQRSWQITMKRGERIVQLQVGG
jgi:Do/DeqQ family serine protease